MHEEVLLFFLKIFVSLTDNQKRYKLHFLRFDKSVRAQKIPSHFFENREGNTFFG